MKYKLTNLLHFSKYFLISIIEKGFNYLITLSLAYFINPEELGKVSLFFAAYAFVSPFININTDGYLAIQWQKNNKEYNNFYTTAGVLNLIATLILFGGCLLFYFLFPHYLDMPLWIFLIIPIVSLFDSIRRNFLSYLVFTNKINQYAIVTVLYTFLSLFLTYGILFLFKKNYEARIFSYSFAALLILILVFYLQVKNKINGNFKAGLLKGIFVYGVLLIPHSIGQIIVDLSDRFFINAMGTQKELGFYSLAYSISSVINLISTAFFLSWVPKMNKHLHENTKESLEKIAKVHTIFLLLLMVVTVIGCISAYFLIHYILPPKYGPTMRYVPYLALTYFFQGVYLCSAGVLFYTQKNKFFLYASIVNIVLNIALNYYLIQYAGTIGAAYATLISMVVFSILITYLSMKQIKIPWFYYLKK
jgi:O-antigen/teichoic acid export membrane protein